MTDITQNETLPESANTTLVNKETLQKLQNASPAPRVMKEDMEARIKKVSFYRMDETVTICHIKLDNGYSVRGESACVNPENYNQEIGNRLAYNTAFCKLWPLFGFLLAESNFRDGQTAAQHTPAVAA